ncbi:MAG: hypothetical protein HC945_02415, partial [Nitrosarchaeum sp.]|nr:hypothetical protein [Nitrosarchaeum sp.]
SNNCQIKDVYQWSSARQEWKQLSQSDTFSNGQVGEGLLLRSSNSCSLQGGTLRPPSFPNGSEDDWDDSDDDRDDRRGNSAVGTINPAGRERGNEQAIESTSKNRVRIIREGTTFKVINNPLWTDEQRRLAEQLVANLQNGGKIKIKQDDNRIEIEAEYEHSDNDNNPSDDDENRQDSDNDNQNGDDEEDDRDEEDKERERCIEDGGLWGEHYPTPDDKPWCIEATDDGGEPCTDSSQCESWCQAPPGSKQGDPVNGTCYPYNEADCTQGVRNGTAQGRGCR